MPVFDRVREWPVPWRSARLGWAVTAAALVAGVPPFLGLPPWADVTLYDVAARTVLRGGVHYRDVFDTNLPGMVWAHAAVRSVVGWGTEPLRAVDLGVVTAVTVLLYRWVRRCGGSAESGAWFAAAVALFYPFTTEFCHVQRDVWMMLPAVAAAGLRARQRRPFVEGVLWSAAVWVKPHVVAPAAAVWLVSLLFRETWRAAARDALGVLAGGLVAGAAGVGWLVASGAWPHFLDVMTRWNPEYAATAWAELPRRPVQTFTYFPPWSLLHLVALPVAVRDLWKRDDPHRAGLASLYLGWAGQALVLQKGLDYVHVPETLLGLAVLHGRGWNAGFAVLPLLAVGAVTGPVADVLAPHPLTDARRLALWPRCFTETGTPRLRDELAYLGRVHCGTQWAELEAVADYLRTVDPPLGDRELVCWHDSTHPLYLLLGVEPGIRFMHAGTALSLRSRRPEIAAEVRAARPRFVVSDLARATWYDDVTADPGGLPRWLPADQRGVFPWDQPVAFRAGRYVVHRIDRPIGAVDIPAWEDLGGTGSERR